MIDFTRRIVRRIGDRIAGAAAAPLAAPGLAVLLAATLVAVPAHADATDAFTPAQRAEIVAIVRNALKTDPTILSDAITALRASSEAKEQEASDQAVKANQAALNGQPGDAIEGNPAGDVTLVEFYDPRCPYCRKVLPDVEKLLQSDRKIRLVEKLIPILGPNSEIDARAIQAAALQGRYAVLQRALMTDSGAPGLDRVKTIAARVGLDVPQLMRDMNSDAVTKVLERNVALAKTLHLTGTPTFVAGTEVIPGAADYGDLKAMVAAARKDG
ncbi:DsbA family protein [Acetobacteraceae bacterium KSS8]|uniref:DsbA family protein n=1 Tax=Endosaccharibacter trunci TaxID=2812733 RepID=A0ABT1W666_9PROT|nr:DsbA family protein [Acetobacteraceae bacterium KSS8]